MNIPPNHQHRHLCHNRQQRHTTSPGLQTNDNGTQPRPPKNPSLDLAMLNPTTDPVTSPPNQQQRHLCQNRRQRHTTSPGLQTSDNGTSAKTVDNGIVLVMLNPTLPPTPSPVHQTSDNGTSAKTVDNGIVLVMLNPTANQILCFSKSCPGTAIINGEMGRKLKMW